MLSKFKMTWFSNLNLSHKLRYIIGMFALGIIILSALSYFTIEKLRVNGDMYNQIVQGKDLIADILPPPDYIVESYLNAFEMLDEPDKAKLNLLIEKAKTLRNEYNERHNFWIQNLPESEMKEDMVKKSYTPAKDFYDIRDTKFVPLVLSGKIDEARYLLDTKMKEKYNLHRSYIDKVVKQANVNNRLLEKEANEIIRVRTISLVVVGLTILVLMFFVVSFIFKKISTPILEIVAASQKVAAGETGISVDINSSDEIGNLGLSFNKMVRKIEKQTEYLNNLPTPVMALDKEFNIEYINKVGAKITGKTQGELIGKKCYNQMKTDQCQTNKCACTQAMKLDKSITEETVARPNDTELPILYTAQTTKNSQGEIDGAIEFITDLTTAKTKENYLNSSARKLLSEMTKFSSGDLTVFLPPENKDVIIDKLFEGFNNTVENIKNMISQVTEVVLATASVSTQISTSAEEMAAGSEEQSNQTNEVAAAMEQMTATVADTTKNILKTNDAAKESKDFASNGQSIIESSIIGMKNIEKVVKQASDIMFKLGKSSEQIGQIVQVINEIADQTNLLALNAAIEAARAGEHGRGFAVVADEVKKLAERTTVATNEIADMVNKIQLDSNNAVSAIQKGNDEVSSGMSAVTTAGESMLKIVESSDKVLEISSQVAASSEEQSATIEQISRSVESINSVTHEAAQAVQQVAGATNDLNELVDQLKNMIGMFKLNEEKVSHNIKNKKLKEYSKV